jgi:hypothetical protein
MGRDGGIRRIVIELISIMDMTRAATAAKPVGHVSRLNVASVAEFKTGYLFIFYSFHISPLRRSFLTHLCPSDLSPESFCKTGKNANRLSQWQATCLSATTVC